jgi:hypothetical protein
MARRYMTEHVLRKPVGIALDKHRNVYVAGYETNNVILVSPSGKNCRQILTKIDGLNEPYSLLINNISSHRYTCQIVTTMYNTFTPILQ